MFDLSAYALRFLEYLVLMVLFGVPLFGWYGSRRPALADALAGWPFMGVLLVSAAVGLVLTGADVVFKTAGIMGMPVADVDRESLGWYLFETSAGRAAMARGALLIAMVWVLGWHRRRGRRRRRRGPACCGLHPSSRGRWLDRSGPDVSGDAPARQGALGHRASAIDA